VGLQSVVFIGDDPVEGDRVCQALPEVLVPEWPRHKMPYYTEAFEQLRCRDAPDISAEDRVRGRMYVAERQRGISPKTWGRSMTSSAALRSSSRSNRLRAPIFHGRRSSSTRRTS